MMRADVLVVGAGPAGIAAATAAARSGRQVVLLDDNAAPGGQIWSRGVNSSRPPHEAGKESALKNLSSSGAELRMGWRVFDVPAPGTLRAICGTTVESFAYRRLVIATGARERLLPFPGWTLPGVFAAGGLQALVKGGFAVKGKRVVVAGSGPLLLAVAAHLRQYGAEIVCVAEQATGKQLLPLIASLLTQPGKLAQAMSYRITLGKTPYRSNCWPVAALGADQVTGVRLTNGTKTWEESCDLIACGFHLVPNTELAALLGCALNGDFVAVNDVQQTSIESIYCAGEPVGISGLDGALVQGRIAGLAAADQFKAAHALSGRRAAAQAFAVRLEAAFRLRDELRTLAAADSIVCRCEDVPYGRLSSCTSWTEAKLQTRCGMGPCQGRICGPATQTIFGWRPGSVRPPLFPVPLAAFSNYASIAPEEMQ